MPKVASRIKHEKLDGSAKPCWVEVRLPESYGQGTNFLHGRHNSNRLKIKYFNNKIDGAFMAKVWFGPAAEGPPGYAHGGSIAAVLDEAMGLAVWSKGFRAVSARIEIDYKLLLPLKTTAIVKMWVHRSKGRKVVAKGRVMNTDGTIYSEARGLFISIDPARFGILSEKMDQAEQRKQFRNKKEPD